MTKEEALKIAENHLRANQDEMSGELIIIDEAAREFSFGWEFYYRSIDKNIELAGNNPFIVEHKSGKILPLPLPMFDEYKMVIAYYEQEYNP